MLAKLAVGVNRCETRTQVFVNPPRVEASNRNDDRPPPDNCMRLTVLAAELVE